MFNKKKILILGGGYEQLPGIKISKSLGIYTIVVDINKYCPGKKYSNKFYNVSTDNFKKVFKISKKENIDGICTFASEKPLRIISKVSKSIKTFSQDLNVINNILNKHNSKKIFKKNKISYIKGSIFNLSKKKKINKFLDFSNEKKYVIKPSDSFGQNGVNLIQDKKNLAYKINNAYKFSTEKKIVIENFEEGIEINLVGIVEDRKIKIISTSQRYTNHDLSFGIAFKHIYPIKLDQKKSIKIKNLCKKIIKAFRINNTVIYFQFLEKENNFKVIEIATRTPGGFMYELSKLVSGYDIIKFTILKSLGVKNSLNKCNIKKKNIKIL